MDFGKSKKIKLSPGQISKGENSENLFKAPEDFYVYTAMGGLSGHTNKYYYEQELKEVDKEKFNDTWWFRSYFEFNDTLSKDNLILLHINGINYVSWNDKEINVPIIWSDNYFSIRGKNSYETYAKFIYDYKRVLDLDIFGWNYELIYIYINYFR